ncbi:MAG: carboxylesterase family protein [Gammaproteobacteria bacterium]|nr:carboxylesterase family protein [Gammaproteobacteria bacterium]
MSSKPVAVTRQGRLRGLAAGDVHAFLGIPFARPPVGHLRFKAPLPPESWRGVRSADSFRAAAPQPELPVDPGLEISVPGLGAPQSEDCLYLNVWTPAVDHARSWSGYTEATSPWGRVRRPTRRPSCGRTTLSWWPSTTGLAPWDSCI